MLNVLYMKGLKLLQDSLLRITISTSHILFERTELFLRKYYVQAQTKLYITVIFIIDMLISCSKIPISRLFEKIVSRQSSTTSNLSKASSLDVFDDPFAVQNICLCPYGRIMTIVCQSHFLVVFKFSLTENVIETTVRNSWVNMMRCAIWYHLYIFKNVKNTHGGVLHLVLSCRLSPLLKVTLLHGCF